jgi:hypothetical protein
LIFSIVVNKENLTVAQFHRKSHLDQLSLKPTTLVSMGYRLGGGVVITDKSLAAIKENCKVLESVAVKVKVSTLAAIVLVYLYIVCQTLFFVHDHNPKSLKNQHFIN